MASVFFFSFVSFSFLFTITFSFVGEKGRAGGGELFLLLLDFLFSFFSIFSFFSSRRVIRLSSTNGGEKCFSFPASAEAAKCSHTRTLSLSLTSFSERQE